MNTHNEQGESVQKTKQERERDAALCIDIFALGDLILCVLQHALLFICCDIDVSHKLVSHTHTTITYTDRDN